MSRTTRCGSMHLRLAFYGRTAVDGERAGTEDVCRQYRSCSAVAAGFGAMTQLFYDAPRACDASRGSGSRFCERQSGAAFPLHSRTMNSP